MNPCSGYPERISAFIDGCLPERERLELMEHMAACPACQAFFDDQIAIHEALADLEAQAPAGFAERVMEQVRLTAQEPPAGRKAPRSRRQGWVAAAACCAVALLGVWAVEGGPGIREDAAADVVAFSTAVTSKAAPQAPSEPAADAAAEEGTPASAAEAAGGMAVNGQSDASLTADLKVAAEAECQEDAADRGALPGAAEENAAVMVGGRIYTWGAVVDGVPEGCEMVAQLEHVSGDTPRENGQLAAAFDAEGLIYADPERPESVYVQITTHWLEEACVRFDLETEAGA